MSQNSQMNPQLISFGGAKGGVGRSVITVLTGIELAKRGERVVLIDLDLGTANLHTLLGMMQPKQSLEQWIIGQEDHLENICSPTGQTNLNLISGAASIFNPSDFSPTQLERLIKELRSLEVDYVLIDLGAGIHPHTLDLFNVCGRNFMITTPEPTSIQNTYAFLKAALIRRAEVTLKDHPWLKKILKRTALTKSSARITSLGEMLDMLRELDIEVNRQLHSQLMSLKVSLIINRAVGDDETQVVETLNGICEKLLRFPLEHSLTLPDDKGIQNAIRKLIPFQQISEELPSKRVIKLWVNEWLVKQSYAPIQEDCLLMIGSPSFLSQDSRETSITTQLPDLSRFDRAAQSAQRDEVMSHLSEPFSALTSQASPPSMSTQRQALHPQAEPLNTSHYAPHIPTVDAYPVEIPHHEEAPMPHHNTGHYLAEGYSEAYDSQAEGYIEPEPFDLILMEDPPRHEVTSIEEEVKTSLGWFHLKTSDLAPFRPSIQTAIYVDGHREVLFEESYEGIYQGGGQGTQIEKRVERVHHESIKHLQQGGIPYWWSVMEERRDR